jgi:hypothetical protein
MLKAIKLFTLLCLMAIIQFAPFAINNSQAQNRQPNSLGGSLNQNHFKVKPGGTIKIDLLVARLNPDDKVDINIQTTPLQVRTIQENGQDNAIKVSLFVTAPVGMTQGQYGLEVSISNGNSFRRNRIAIEVVETNQRGPQITFASFDPQSAMLYLNGEGLGQLPTVMVNGKDVSAAITSAFDGTLVLEDKTGNKFFFKKGNNEILVSVYGQVSNSYILFLNQQ